MKDPASSEPEAHAPTHSPYAPPPLIADHSAVPPVILPERMPAGVSFVYAIAMTVLTALPMMISELRDLSSVMLLYLLTPPLGIGGFVLLCLAYFQRGGPPVRSAAWKVFVTLAVPLGSMILFVPTCIGTSIFIYPAIGRSIGELAMLIPFFLAYWVTCFLVAMRIRSRMSRPVEELAQGPYASLSPPSNPSS